MASLKSKAIPSSSNSEKTNLSNNETSLYTWAVCKTTESGNSWPGRREEGVLPQAETGLFRDGTPAAFTESTSW
jgi:hypothetical protein